MNAAESVAASEPPPRNATGGTNHPNRPPPRAIECSCRSKCTMRRRPRRHDASKSTAIMACVQEENHASYMEVSQAGSREKSQKTAENSTDRHAVSYAIPTIA